jgi:hypothetical protein
MEAGARTFEHELGYSWVQSEAVLRASHALRSGDEVWLIDPVDSGLDVDHAIGDGNLVGVIQLLDRHNRDSLELAERFEVPLFRLPADLPDSPFTPFSVIDRPKWREVGLWWPEKRALVVAEAVSTSADLAVADTGIAVHPLLRLTPPGALRRYPDVDHLLTGHGAPLHGDDLGPRIQHALDKSRTDIPRLITKLPKMVMGGRL